MLTRSQELEHSDSLAEVHLHYRGGGESVRFKRRASRGEVRGALADTWHASRHEINEEISGPIKTEEL
jgi:hypothetical protein